MDNKHMALKHYKVKKICVNLLAIDRLFGLIILKFLSCFCYYTNQLPCQNSKKPNFFFNSLVKVFPKKYRFIKKK